MDAARFINSKDIREYLREIDYIFDPIETAWLIYQSRNASIDEKHRAWNELIETMPDCAIDEGFNLKPRESLHSFLREFMDYQRDYLSMMHQAESGYVYKYSHYEKRCPAHRFDDDSIFATYSECKKDALEIGEELERFSIEKIKLGSKHEHVTEYLDDSGKVIDIYENTGDARGDDLVFCGFDGMWFDFPTPFKKGDILYAPVYFGREPFVVAEVGKEGFSKERINELKKRNWDSSDMTARGYFADSEGNIYWEVLQNYMDCEFCKKELTGSNRTLKAMSCFLKGDINEEELVRAYHRILTDEYSKRCAPDDLWRKNMVMAGAEEKQKIRIWLDDERDAPKGYLHCRSVNEAKSAVEKCEHDGNEIEIIDCDHDLGEYSGDGGDGIKLIKWLAERKSFYPVGVHAMESAGKENMMREISRYWGKG